MLMIVLERSTDNVSMIKKHLLCFERKTKRHVIRAIVYSLVMVCFIGKFGILLKMFIKYSTIGLLLSKR